MSFETTNGLKCAPEVISEGLKIKHFLGGMPPDPPRGCVPAHSPLAPQIFSKYHFAPLVYFSKWNTAHPGVHCITPSYTVMTYSQWHDLHLPSPPAAVIKICMSACMWTLLTLLKPTRQTYHGLVCCRWLALTVCHMNTSLYIIKMHILGRVYGPIARLLE